MIEAKIKVGNVEVTKQHLRTLERKTPNVLANAINRTTTNIKKTMAQQTASRYYIKSGDVRKTISIRRASRSTLNGAAVSRSSPISLAKFKVSPNRPVSYSGGKASPKAYKAAVKKGEPLKALDTDPKAFIATVKAGDEKEHMGLFVRKTGEERDKAIDERKKGFDKRYKGKRSPIKQLYGPTAPSMINNDDSIEIIQNEAKSTLQKRIDAEIANILRKG
jgi:hypothetical protein